MSDLTHYEVRLVRAPKDKVWKTVSDLKKDFTDVENIKVTGSGKGATRTLDFGKRVREETVVDLKDNESFVLDVKQGDKVAGRMELELEDHDLGTMVIHRAFLDVKGPIRSLTTRGRVKKELKQRLDGIKDALEGGATVVKKSSSTKAKKAGSEKAEAKKASKDAKASAKKREAKASKKGAKTD